jgi:hypothetical protein
MYAIEEFECKLILYRLRVRKVPQFCCSLSRSHVRCSLFAVLSPVLVFAVRCSRARDCSDTVHHVCCTVCSVTGGEGGGRWRSPIIQMTQG